MSKDLIFKRPDGVEFNKGPIKCIHEGNYRDTNITSVLLPDCLEAIEYEAFYHCENLTSVTFPDSTINIGPKAFFNCHNLESVIIKNPVILKYAAFSHNIGLLNISVNCENIPEECFYNSGYNGVDIKLVNTKLIGLRAFYSANIKSLKLPDTLKTIGFEAFKDANFYESTLRLPEGLQFIKQDAFKNVSTLTDIYLPDSLISIENLAECGLKLHMSKILAEKLNIEENENITINSIENIIDRMTFKEYNKIMLQNSEVIVLNNDGNIS